MTSPRVALIRQRYAHDGGAERFVSRTLDALKSRNVPLTLVTREWHGAEGFEVKICNPFYIGRLWRDWSFARAACRSVQGGLFDLVQSHERLACCDIYRAGDGVHREWLKQRARAQGPLGRFGTALNPYHYYVKAAEKRLFGSARLKAVICNSKMVKDEIRNHFGVAEEKLHVIYSGVDTQVFHPDLKRHRAAVRAQYVVPEDATLFLFVGSGFERKGVSTLLEAMARLSANTYLLVVGRDKKLEKYRARAQRLGLGSRVRFTGRQADVKPFYGAADCLVLPTLYDPFPNVALEAMASGVPVITSSKCGAAELIRDGENGFVCEAHDSIALTERMRLLADRERGERVGKAARDTVAGLHLETMSNKLLDLYRSLLSRS